MCGTSSLETTFLHITKRLVWVKPGGLLTRMKEKKDISKLNAKQNRFCDEYLIDLNGKQAAIRAGYSPKTAEVQAARLLSYAKVQEKVQQLQKEARNKAEVSREEVLSTLAAIMRAKLPDYFTDGKKLDMTKLTDDQKLAMESIRVSGSSFTIKLTSKIAAIERINRMLGYDLPEDLNVNVNKLSDDALDNLLMKIAAKNG